MKQEHSAYAELFRRGNVAFAGALPGDEHTLGRAKTLRATAFVFGDFDGESFVIQSIREGMRAAIQLPYRAMLERRWPIPTEGAGIWRAQP